MMKVKITSGIYGYRKPGSKRPDPKHAGDVIDLPDEEAMRLEQLKVGVILSAAEEHHAESVATPSVSQSDGTLGVDKDEDETAADGAVIPDELDIVDGHFTEDSLMTMTCANMEKLAADLGIDVSKCKNKSEIASLLAEVELDADEESETPPDLGAEAPVE
nr:hypothetical protein [uncultured Agathobaculum sp.]